MVKYTYSFIGSDGKRKKARGGFDTKKKAEDDLKKIKTREKIEFGKIQKITKSIRIVRIK